MAKKSEFSIARSFVKHVLRGGLKGTGAAAEAVINPLKLVDAVTGVLDEVIFGILEDKAAKEESQKLHEKLDRLLEEQAKGADARETDFAEVIAGLHLQADFNEKVEAELGKILSLLKEPDKADVPEKFAAAVDRVLARDEELLEAFLDKLGALSEEHAALSSEHGEIIAKEDEITAAIEALGKRIETIRATGDDLRKEQKVRETRVFLSKLPITGRELFGRDKELMTLSRAWVSRKTKIISFVAWGGVGKTALVNEWLNRMGEKSWGGAERVYGWSFYSQGTREDRQASSDTFLAHSLEWFGDKETAESAKSAWNKGVRLAELIRGQKTLLILDGVEPLQYPPGPMQGRLKDQGLQGLLRELSHGMNGLCVITTREKIEDLEGQVGHTVRRVELENLSTEAGVELLKYLGVKTGSKKEFEEAVEEVKGHALALNLLGTFVGTVHDGDIRKRDKVEKLAIEEEEKGGHAKRVMEFYERWLREKNKAEVDILYLMGLFDRPAEAGAIAKLREQPAIKGLTDNIVSLSDAKWKYAVKHLRDLGLLGKEDEGGSGDLDCHPLVREHFGQKLKEGRAEAWREAHSRLYEYYKGVPEKEQPDTIEEMEPLFRAVYHGCAAGKHPETFDDVYWERIKRGHEHYSTKQLGAFGSDLGAVACFFEKVWDRPAAGLRDADKALLLSFAGFRLRAVGRLGEAAEPFEASLGVLVAQNDWPQAAGQAGNVSELYLTLGEVGKAVEFGRRSVEYADKTGDEFQRVTERTTLADALHHAGDVGEARRLFEEAERMQIEDQPGYRYLYSLRGYLYCDLLLSEGKMGEVKERAEWSIEIAKGNTWLLDIALDKLSLGRAWLAEAASKIKDKKANIKVAEKDLDEAGRWLNEAVGGLRKAGTQDHLPRGLLARAGYYRAAGNYEKARGDLEEAREIAERGEMKLWLADYHLESARLARSEKDKEKMGWHCEEAGRLIKKYGYHRRDGEVEELEQKNPDHKGRG